MSLRDYPAFGPLTDKISRTISMGNVSHAYIIEGDTCIDKEAFARDMIKGVFCHEAPGIGCDCCATCRKIDHDNYEDLYYVRPDGQSVRDGAIAELQEKLKNKPTGGRGNVAIIAGADSMTERAQNRLLKTLEEPAPGTMIFLLSENTENLLVTITSRCIVYRLGNFLQEEGEDLSFAGEMMDMILEGAYFCDIKDKLDKGIKDRQEAFQFLDGLERLFRRYLSGERAGAFRKERIVECVNYTEEVRRDLLANVNYRYAIRNLILKIGG